MTNGPKRQSRILLIGIVCAVVMVISGGAIVIKALLGTSDDRFLTVVGCLLVASGLLNVVVWWRQLFALRQRGRESR